MYRSAIWIEMRYNSEMKRWCLLPRCSFDNFGNKKKIHFTNKAMMNLELHHNPKKDLKNMHLLNMSELNVQDNKK